MLMKNFRLTPRRQKMPRFVAGRLRSTITWMIGVEQHASAYGVVISE
jgi:hypothetical protein